MKQEKISFKVKRLKRRADFLFNNGEFRPRAVSSVKIYNRKRLQKFDNKSDFLYNTDIK